MKRILVSRLFAVGEHERPVGFLAIEEDEQQTWEDRLRQSNWPRFEFVRIDASHTSPVRDEPDDVLMLCASAFGHGCLTAVSGRDESALGLPLARWNEEQQQVEVVPYDDYMARCLSINNPPLAALLSELREDGILATNVVACR